MGLNQSAQVGFGLCSSAANSLSTLPSQRPFSAHPKTACIGPQTQALPSTFPDRSISARTTVDRVHRLLHDVFHLGLHYVQVFGLSSTSGALSASVNIFDGAVAERQRDNALGFRCQLRV